MSFPPANVSVALFANYFEQEQMSSPNPVHQRRAWDRLRRLSQEPDNLFVIHYSCEDLYSRPEGTTPRVTSIAMRRYGSGQTFLYSIHQCGERQKVPLAEMPAEYNKLEKRMLSDFYAQVRQLPNVEFVHWNMRDKNYGFAALEHRMSVLGGKSEPIADARKHDLAALMYEIYGDTYMDAPRLQNLYRQNEIPHPDFKSGQEEADLFSSGGYVALDQSVLRKVEVISRLLRKAHERTLKTHASWWTVHGGRLREIVQLVKDHPVISLTLSVIGAVGVIIKLGSYVF